MAVKGVQRHKTVMEILTERKPVEDDKLAQAEAEANTSNKPIQTVLLEKELMTKEALVKLLSEEWKVEIADIANMDIDGETVKIVPEGVARRHLALPFEKGESSLSVAMANPLDMFITEDLQTRTGLEIKPFLALPQDIVANIDAAYGKGGGALMSKIKQDEEASGKSFLEDWKPDEGGKGLEVIKEGPRASDITKVDASAPEVEKMVNAIILSAIKMKASDIHIEPMEDPTGKNSKVVLRYRVDGALRPGPFSIGRGVRGAPGRAGRRLEALRERGVRRLRGRRLQGPPGPPGAPGHDRGAELPRGPGRLGRGDPRPGREGRHADARPGRPREGEARAHHGARGPGARGRGLKAALLRA